MEGLELEEGVEIVGKKKRKCLRGYKLLKGGEEIEITANGYNRLIRGEYIPRYMKGLMRLWRGGWRWKKNNG